MAFMMKKKVKDKTTMTAREVAVLGEDFRSQFKVFGEGLDALKAKLEKIDTRFNGLDTKVDRLDIRFNGLDTKVDSVYTQVGKLTEDVGIIKVDIRTVKTDIAEIKETLKGHDKRLAHLESVK